MEDLKKTALSLVKRLGAHPGIRSHEFGGLMKKEIGRYLKGGEDRQILSELREDGEIKFVTEKGCPTYCWIVLAGWQDRPNPKFIHLPKEECDLFGIF